MKSNVMTGQNKAWQNLTYSMTGHDMIYSRHKRRYKRQWSEMSCPVVLCKVASCDAMSCHTLVAPTRNNMTSYAITWPDMSSFVVDELDVTWYDISLPGHYITGEREVIGWHDLTWQLHDITWHDMTGRTPDDVTYHDVTGDEGSFDVMALSWPDLTWQQMKIRQMTWHGIEWQDNWAWHEITEQMTDDMVYTCISWHDITGD